MKEAKLTTFGKVVMAAVALGVVGTLGEMGYSSYKFREAVAEMENTDEVLDSFLSFKSVDHHASLFQSKGALRATIEDACNPDKSIVFNVPYEIDHLPFMPDQFSASIKKEVLASPLRRSRIAKDDSMSELTITGQFDGKSNFQADAVIKAATWVNQNTGISQTLEDTTVKLRSELGVTVVDIKGSEYISVDQGRRSSFENFEISGTLQPEKSTFLKFTAKAGKYKGANILVMSPVLESNLNVTDNKAVGEISLSSPLLSVAGSPAENLSVTLSANINDFSSLRKMKTLFDAECDQLKLDEEDRINQAIYASRLVDSGMEARMSNISWEGPRGTGTGSASVGISRVLDKKTGLPDIYAGMVASGSLDIEDGYEGVPFVDKLINDGFLRKDNKGLTVRFSLKDKNLSLNGKKDEVLTTEYGSRLNDYFDQIAPVMESALSLDKVK